MEDKLNGLKNTPLLIKKRKWEKLIRSYKYSVYYMLNPSRRWLLRKAMEGNPYDLSLKYYYLSTLKKGSIEYLHTLGSIVSNRLFPVFPMKGYVKRLMLDKRSVNRGKLKFKISNHYVKGAFIKDAPRSSLQKFQFADLILEVNGIRITNSVQFNNYINSVKDGKFLKIKFRRYSDKSMHICNIRKRDLNIRVFNVEKVSGLSIDRLKIIGNRGK